MSTCTKVDPNECLPSCERATIHKDSGNDMFQIDESTWETVV